MKPLDPLALPLEGVQLIEASAGTGKTFTITTLYLRLLLERGLTVQQIVVVTFTKAATAELRSRIRKRLREALVAFDAPQAADETLRQLIESCPSRTAARQRLAQSLRELDEASVFTIHGFCQRMLLEYAFESKLRFEVDLIVDQRSLVQQIVQDFWASTVTSFSEAEVRYLQGAQVGLKDLMSLAYAAIQWPDMTLVAESRKLETEPALEAYLRARQQARKAWQECAAEVQKLLFDCTALYRQSYKRETLERWFEELRALFETESRSLLNYTEAVNRLSPGTLQRATKNGRATPEHPFFVACQTLEACHSEAVAAFESWLVRLKGELVNFARREAKQRKRERGLMSFDDLLQMMAEALDGPRGEVLAKRIREQYPAALIDEFQDTDPVQYAVFSRIYGKQPSSLFLIGDPKQAIYAFRGADIFAYLKAVADAGQNCWTLDTNYRSDKSLLQALNSLLSRPHRPFLLDGIEYLQVKPRPGATDAFTAATRTEPLEILFVERASIGTDRPINRRWYDRHLPEWIAADIARLLQSDARLEGKPVKPSDIAILTRTNQQAQILGQALRNLNIPSALIGDTSVFDTPEADEMRLLLRAMAEPASAGALRSALCTSFMGVSASELAALSNDESAWEAWVESFRQLYDLWEKRGFVHAMQSLIRQRDVSARTLALIDGERRLTNLRHLTELLHHAETELHLGTTGLLSWFDDMLFNPLAREGMAPDAQQIRLESDDYAVQLTTMHKSKGLEYPIVYCPYLWRDANLFPQETRHLKVHDADAEHRLVLDVRPAAAKAEALALAQREALAENLRLLYVAITRAKHKTVLVWGAFHRAGDSPLGYMLYQPREELGALAETPSARIAHMSDAELLRDLEALAQASGGTIGVRTLHAEPAPAYRRETDETGMLSARLLARQIDTSFRISSFSQLTRSSHRLSVSASLGKDVDEASVDDFAPPASAATDPLVTLHEFPRGARAGELLHGILERLDFVTRADLEKLTEAELQRHGLPIEHWREPVVRALSEVLAVTLPGAEDLSLGSIEMSRRVSEMEFTLPLHAATSRAPVPITSSQLARIFERHARQLPQSYLEQLERLGFAPLTGFLRGFIDLIFEHRGKYYVVDYKSNHLGDKASDYAPSRLAPAMAQHHYYLQYHLYVAALHRYLAARLGDYQYASHFGGVYYLFLRGMSPQHPPGSGVYWSRPEQGLIEALCHLFDGQLEQGV